MWFSCNESISSCMALNHFRLWVSFLASSKLSGSPSSVSSTRSSYGNLRGALLSLRGYLRPLFGTVGSSSTSSSELDSILRLAGSLCSSIDSRFCRVLNRSTSSHLISIESTPSQFDRASTILSLPIDNCLLFHEEDVSTPNHLFLG